MTNVCGKKRLTSMHQARRILEAKIKASVVEWLTKRGIASRGEVGSAAAFASFELINECGTSMLILRCILLGRLACFCSSDTMLAESSRQEGKTHAFSAAFGRFLYQLHAIFSQQNHLRVMNTGSFFFVKFSDKDPLVFFVVYKHVKISSYGASQHEPL